jgi:hypothetical protein
VSSNLPAVIDHAIASALLFGVGQILRVAAGPIVVGGRLTILVAAALQLLARAA